jgi:hypothetical protein
MTGRVEDLSMSYSEDIDHFQPTTVFTVEGYHTVFPVLVGIPLRVRH